MIRRSLVAASVLGVMSAAGLVNGAATAATGSAAQASDDTVSKTISKAAQAKTKGYWSSSRMQKAKDAAVLVKGKSKNVNPAKVARGSAKVVQGTATAAAPKAPQAAYGGGYYTGGGKVVQTTGKIFFTLAGSDYVCSGSSTVAANKSLVQTAGHCLNEGPGGFATNFTFVPAYNNGSAPYGQFAATNLYTSTQWANSGDFDYDIGYAKVGTSGGKTLTDAVGAQGVGFNLARGQYMYSFGYPAASPYAGEKIAWCHGTVVADTYGGSSDQGLACNMTGGSSGGPWFTSYSTSTGVGTLNSVNSFKYTAGPQSGNMFGPYFGSVIQGVYNQAQG